MGDYVVCKLPPFLQAFIHGIRYVRRKLWRGALHYEWHVITGYLWFRSVVVPVSIESKINSCSKMVCTRSALHATITHIIRSDKQTTLRSTCFEPKSEARPCLPPQVDRLLPLFYERSSRYAQQVHRLEDVGPGAKPEMNHYDVPV